MRIYKKLEDCMDDTIKVRDILEYCESASESVSRLADKAIKSMGKGETTVSACGAVAYFKNEEEIFRYHIPNIITCMINAPLQKEGGEDDKQ